MPGSLFPSCKSSWIKSVFTALATVWPRFPLIIAQYLGYCLHSKTALIEWWIRQIWMNKQMHEWTFSPLHSQRAGVSSTDEMTALKRLSPYSALVQNRYLLHESDGLVGERKKSLPLLILRSQAGALYTGLTKDKLTREKHKNLFSISFMWHRRIHKEWRPEEAVKPKYFYTRFDEDWEVVVKCDRTKGYEIKLVNWGEFSKAWSFGFLLASLHLWR